MLYKVESSGLLSDNMLTLQQDRAADNTARQVRGPEVQTWKLLGRGHDSRIVPKLLEE